MKKKLIGLSIALFATALFPGMAIAKDTEDIPYPKVEYTVNMDMNEVEFTLTALNPDQTYRLGKVQLFVVEYDDEGCLTGVTIKNAGIGDGDSVSITAELPMTDNYKFLIWDGNNAALTEVIDEIVIEPEPTLEPTPEPSPEPTPFPTLAPGEQIKIMPLGDSITNGFTVAGAYRNKLGELLVQNELSQYVDFVGSQNTGSGYDNDNEGHSGWAIAAIPASGDIEGKGRQGLTTNIDSWMTTYAPDIVLLQIGTNDILSLYDLDNAPARLETLVDKVLAKLPETGKLYIAKIPYIAQNATYNKTGKSQAELDVIVDTYNAAVSDLAEEKNLTLVNFNGVLELSDMKEGIHPNSDGYAKMGTLWYNTIEEEIRMRAGK